MADVTPASGIRIPLDVKAAAQARAAADGLTLTDVVVAYLARYGSRTTVADASLTEAAADLERLAARWVPLLRDYAETLG